MAIHEAVLAILKSWNVDPSGIENAMFYWDDPKKSTLPSVKDFKTGADLEEYLNSGKRLNAPTKIELHPIGQRAILQSQEILENNPHLDRDDQPEFMSVKFRLNGAFALSLCSQLNIHTSFYKAKQHGTPLRGDAKLLEWYTHEIAKCYSEDMRCISDLLAFGVPFFCRNEDGAMSPIPPDSKLHHQITALHYLEDDVTLRAEPDWASGVYYRPQDANLFWAMMERDPEDKNSLAMYYAALRQKHGEDAGIPPNPAQANSDKALELAANSPTLDKLRKAIAQFPKKYPDYQSCPPRLDADIRNWLEADVDCGERERQVFGKIIAEHFDIR
jgi:hypothetical protein